jgi:hypothetical protein
MQKRYQRLESRCYDLLSTILIQIQLKSTCIEPIRCGWCLSLRGDGVGRAHSFDQSTLTPHTSSVSSRLPPLTHVFSLSFPQSFRKIDKHICTWPRRWDCQVCRDRL